MCDVSLLNVSYVHVWLIIVYVTTKYKWMCISAGDDAKIRVWRVPEGGLKETLTEPELILQGRNESTLKNDNNYDDNASKEVE